MKVKEIKIEEIFTIDSMHLHLRPKLKIKEGFVDMSSQYIYINKEEVAATVCTESELNRIQQNWRMTSEKFKGYKQFLIRKYVVRNKK